MTTFVRRWTVEECDTLRNIGLLEGKYELIEGIILEKMGQSGRHARTIRALFNALLRLFSGEQMLIQLPIRIPNALGQYNEPLPDVAVTKEGYRAYKENPLPQDLLLVAEVSDTTVKSDLTTKASLYARAGVMEYWVVDLEANRVVVHRQPSEAGYQEVTEHTQEQAIAPLASPTGSLALAELFEE
jgi:Uma2 family endonuclease